jgi:hypothetical protein
MLTRRPNEWYALRKRVLYKIVVFTTEAGVCPLIMYKKEDNTKVIVGEVSAKVKLIIWSEI